MDYQDTTNDVFFIVSGTVRVKLQLVSGREVLLREINAGEFFGELAAIDNQPRSSGIVAVTDVIAARMPASVFRAAVHAHSDVCDQLLALLAREVRILANRVNEFTTLDARHRTYAVLLRLSRPEAANALAAAGARGDRGPCQQPARGGSARARGTRARRSARAPSRRAGAHGYAAAASIDRGGNRIGLITPR
jgi:hypothetical protein